MDQTVSDQCRVQVRNSSASSPDLAATTTHSSNFFHCEAAAPRRRLAVIATPPARPEINARGSSWDGRFAGAARPSSSMAFGQNMPIDSGQIALEREACGCRALANLFGAFHGAPIHPDKSCLQRSKPACRT